MQVRAAVTVGGGYPSRTEGFPLAAYIQEVLRAGNPRRRVERARNIHIPGALVDRYVVSI